MRWLILSGEKPVGEVRAPSAESALRSARRFIRGWNRNTLTVEPYSRQRRRGQMRLFA